MRDPYNREITYLRVSITDLCNLRCTYCMPNGVDKRSHRDILRYEEFVEIITAAAQLGIKKVRITGGEPLVRPGVVDFCGMVSAIPGVEEVTITTNGVLLKKYAAGLKAAGVNRVNISLDSLNPQRFHQITQVGRLEDVLEGIQAATDAGLLPLKLNAVLMAGFNDDEVPRFVELTRNQPIQVRFIELMPIGAGAELEKRAYLPGDEVLRRCPELMPLPEDGGVARIYRLPDGVGTVGLISPLSRHFCAQCNRLRLTSEGNLKPCLHSNQEILVRGYHGEELLERIRLAINSKPKMHVELDGDHASQAGRNMNTIGG